MNVNSSILTDIKKLLGLVAEDTSFDTDVIIHINDCFERLHDLGVGPKSIFMITGPKETWQEFFGTTEVRPGSFLICTNMSREHLMPRQEDCLTLSTGRSRQQSGFSMSQLIRLTKRKKSWI